MRVNFSRTAGGLQRPVAPRPARLCSGIPERHVCPHGSRFLAAPLQCGVCVPGRGQSVCQLSALPFNSCRHPGAGWRRVASPELCAVCPVWPHEGQRPSSHLHRCHPCRRVSRSVVSDSCDPVDCNPPGSSVHGIPQTRIQGWVATPFSRESS